MIRIEPLVRIASTSALATALGLAAVSAVFLIDGTNVPVEDARQTVDVITPPATADELDAAAQRLVQSAVGRRVGVSTVSRRDGGGLQVDLVGREPSVDDKQKLARAAGVPLSGISYTPDNGLTYLPEKLS
ncbi:hypothetical protein [Aeromicrobium sp. Root472D3]|uniref:hypothetical protein n=1 Tax=Aeromicrobium sp. Root472D3 TaxID=1736540 RepID=UPI0006F57226|nr:hypothetical protein [Aeromicrobium sp. Root472D3]KQX74447.1 hypothetical protein ASD10_04200 [Aeromicrobium sp. Root472D3]